MSKYIVVSVEVKDHEPIADVERRLSDAGCRVLHTSSKMMSGVDLDRMVHALGTGRIGQTGGPGLSTR